jgi:transcriptional regulator with XRE-family HTH domain
MSQHQLSAAVKGIGGGTCPTHISHIEGQRRVPTLRTLVAFCRVLNCSADYLLGATPPITVPGFTGPDEDAFCAEVGEVLP